jgi:peptidoglycan/LPS O-acetylase OafA/YrhL
MAFWSWAAPGDLPFNAAAGSVRFEALESFTWFGWSGVETFFVLSGFVICASASEATPYGFLRGRIGRLYPAVWICATITGAVSLALHLVPPQELAGDYLRSLAIFSKGPWVDRVYKTLIPEGVFYAIIFFLLSARWFRPTERVAVLLGAYGLLFWAFKIVYPVGPGVFSYFSCYAIFFALGMMIWVIKQSGASRFRAGAIGVLCIAGAAEVHMVALTRLAPFVAHAHLGVAAFVWLGSVVAIMVSVFCNDRITARLGRAAPVLRTIGLMTYPLYLIHDVAGSAILRTSVLVGQNAALVLALAGSLGAAYAVVRIEPLLRRPILSGLDTLAGRCRKFFGLAWQALSSGRGRVA